MSYRNETRYYVTGVGTFATADVLATFTMPEGQYARVECAGAGAGEVELEHSTDGVTWTSLGATDANGELVINSSTNPTDIPFKVNGRLITPAGTTTTTCYVATGR